MKPEAKKANGICEWPGYRTRHARTVRFAAMDETNQPSLFLRLSLLTLGFSFYIVWAIATCFLCTDALVARACPIGRQGQKSWKGDDLRAWGCWAGYERRRENTKHGLEGPARLKYTMGAHTETDFAASSIPAGCSSTGKHACWRIRCRETGYLESVSRTWVLPHGGLGEGEALPKPFVHEL